MIDFDEVAAIANMPPVRIHATNDEDMNDPVDRFWNHFFMLTPRSGRSGDLRWSFKETIGSSVGRAL